MLEKKTLPDYLSDPKYLFTDKIIQIPSSVYQNQVIAISEEEVHELFAAGAADSVSIYRHHSLEELTQFAKNSTNYNEGLVLIMKAVPDISLNDIEKIIEALSSSCNNVRVSVSFGDNFESLVILQR